MRIRVFQSDKGDCLLLRTNDRKNILVDGGMRKSYEAHVRPFLGRMRTDGQALDLVYVSHIDRDHISGVLELFDNEILWRRYLFHRDNPAGNRRVRKPRLARPPEVKNVWHNAFHTQLKDNRGAIEDMLAAYSRVWGSIEPDEFQMSAEHAVNLISSKKEAVQLSNRIGKNQLNIPLNAQFNSKLALRPGRADTIRLGNSRIRVLGPSNADLRKLRSDWNTWLRNSKETLRDLRRKAREDERNIGNSTLIQNFLANARDRGGVTVPNLASLMLQIDEGGDTVLLTGDGHSEDVLIGLEKQKLLRADGTYHVNVLKIPHHGSTHNFEPKLDFFKRVTADNYVFCGNGADTNPEIDVINLLFASRIGPQNQKSNSAEVDNDFRVWINSHESVSTSRKRKSHMKKLEKRVDFYVRRSGGKASSRFLKKSSFEFKI